MMNDLTNRKKNRLIDCNYCDGAYFITICAADKECIFSSVRGDDVIGSYTELSELGKLACSVIAVVEDRFEVCIEKYVIMPNHVHMIILMDGERTGASPAPTVSDVVGAYKSIVANEYLKVCKRNNRIMGKVWQRSFYDHVIRDEDDYLVKAQYIENNPAKWIEDEYYNV